MKNLPNACKNGMEVDAFSKEFKVKNAVWALIRAWDNVIPATLKDVWGTFWLASMYNESEAEPDFDAFHVSHEKKLGSDLLEYSKGTTDNVAKELQESDLQEWRDVDSDMPVIHQLTYGKIIDMVLNPVHEKDKNCVDDDGGELLEEKISKDKWIRLAEDIISGLEQRSYIS